MKSGPKSGRFAALRVGAFRCLLPLVTALALGTGVAQSAPFAYATNLLPASVSVIDTASNQISAMIAFPAGSNPTDAALTPDLKKVYVTGNNSHVYVIDAATNTVGANPITVGGLPNGIALTPDGRHAYVACAYTSTVSVIDTATDTVSATIALPSGTNLTNVAITPDGQRAYVTAQSANAVYVLDTNTNTVLGTPIAVAGHPEGIAVTPDGNEIYVTHNDAVAGVSVIDAASNTVVATFAGPYVFAVTFTPDGKRAYATGGGGAGYTLIIDTATRVLLQTLSLGGNDVGITADGKQAYFTGGGANILSVIDTTTNMQTATISGLSLPQNVAVRPLPPGVAVPNVVGKTQAGAMSAIRGAALTVGTITPQPSSAVALGSVISQAPAAGVLVAADAPVGLVVSSGVAVPAVVGATQADAMRTLSGAGLTVGTLTQQPSATVVSGDVISQSPAAGTNVTGGSAVDLVVSSGSPLGDEVGRGGGGGLDALVLAALVGSLMARWHKKAAHNRAGAESDGRDGGPAA
jgi:YVTN family beta-propeller protein